MSVRREVFRDIFQRYPYDVPLAEWPWQDGGVAAQSEEAIAHADLASAVWRVVVWDDPVNLMSYVEYVFETYFGMPFPQAHLVMLQVHHEGRAVVAEGGRDEMVKHVHAMHRYGLWATLEQGS